MCALKRCFTDTWRLCVGIYTRVGDYLPYQPATACWTTSHSVTAVFAFILACGSFRACLALASVQSVHAVAAKFAPPTPELAALLKFFLCGVAAFLPQFGRASFALMALATLLFATQLQIIQSTVPPNLELTVITAAVIGGVSILGGTGTVIGSTLAAILFAAIGSALIFTNVSAYWLRAVIGVLILVTVLADMIRRRRQGRA